MKPAWHKAIKVAPALLLAALLATAFLLHGNLLHQNITYAAGQVAVTRTIQPSSADSYVDQNIPGTNYGTATTMKVDSKTAALDRSFVKFDLSSIPTGSTISSATLSLYLWAAPEAERTHAVCRVTADWVETTITWNVQPSFAAATATTLTGITAGVWLSWTVTTDVTAWIETQAAINYGWCVKDNAEGTTAVRRGEYYTRNYTTDTTLRPKLAVTYTAPFDSYASDYTTVKDTYSVYGELIYMKGTGLAAGSYTVKYYDANATEIGSETKTIGVGEELRSSMPCNTNPNAAPGTWRAKAFNGLGVLIAEDTFTVEQSAIPEFPTVIAGIAVAGLCAAIYYWMRQRVYRVRRVY